MVVRDSLKIKTHEWASAWSSKSTVVNVSVDCLEATTSICWSPHPQCGGVRRWAFGRWSGLNATLSEGPHDGISASVRRVPSELPLLLCYVRTNWEGGLWKPGRQLSLCPEWVGALSWASSFQICEQELLLFILPSQLKLIFLFLAIPHSLFFVKYIVIYGVIRDMSKTAIYGRIYLLTNFRPLL